MTVNIIHFWSRTYDCIFCKKIVFRAFDMNDMNDTGWENGRASTPLVKKLTHKKTLWSPYTYNALRCTYILLYI